MRNLLVYTVPLAEISLADLPRFGGKNASLGELSRNLGHQGIRVPDGFATSAEAYREFIRANNLDAPLRELLATLDTAAFSNLAEVGAAARDLIRAASLPQTLSEEILRAYHDLRGRAGETISLAVRSSATAEDLPTASFAGQLESFLNVQGDQALLHACHHCFASLFTDRAIQYRVRNGFAHLDVAVSVGVQVMVRADQGSAGVMFTLDPDSGFENVVLVSSAWGLGENVVKGNVNADEFLVFKPTLPTAARPIIARTLGTKELTMGYAEVGQTLNRPTSPEARDRFSLSDPEVAQLARWALAIQRHYGRHMDIEWAKDGIRNELYIVQARPETVHSIRPRTLSYTEFTLKTKAEPLCSGIGLGNRIVAGPARVLRSPADIALLQPGEILVTHRTDPDWDPVLKKAAAIVTDQGGRTSHAAIVAREVGAIAVVGTGNATQAIQDGELVTVSAPGGETGRVYRGRLAWEEKTTDLTGLPKPRTKVMLILAHPDQAFRQSFLPHDGVGLLRMEFIINNAIGIHPMALHGFDTLADAAARAEIELRTRAYPDKKDFFVHRLAESVARIAAAFYPKDVIVRMSDFKSNEYADLIGGKAFEPVEENPMIGFRGASRYYHPRYKAGFELECAAMKMVREEMGLRNVKLMIPFCRTLGEAEKTIAIMEACGLVRGQEGLELYMMLEIPSNALLAEEFAAHFDGFSIGSNDLTQLVLGADRDSDLLSDIFSPFDPAVMALIRMAISKARATGTKIGLCGQAPSDFPEYARFLVACGIDSISFNPDAMIKGLENIVQAEAAQLNPQDA